MVKPLKVDALQFNEIYRINFFFFFFFNYHFIFFIIKNIFLSYGREQNILSEKCRKMINFIDKCLFDLTW